MTAIRYCAAAALVAALAGAAFAQRPDTARTIEAENAVLAAEVAATGAALERARAELARLQRSEDAITAGMQRIEHRAEVRALGREFAQVMTEELSLLPRSAQFAAARDARRHLLEATGDANLRVERALGRLADLDEAVAARLAAAQVPAAERPQAVPAVRAALAGQSALLASLDGLQGELMRALRDTGDAERSLIERSEAARDELTRLLLWLPARTGREAVTELPAALAWTISPANWHAAAAILRDEVVRSPVWPTIAVLAAIGLFAARRRLQRGLVALAPVAVGYERYRIGHALAVVAITLALALPGPILLWTAAAPLAAASGAGTFTAALGHALDGTGRLLLSLSALGWLLDPRGVAVRHFGWDEAAVTFAGRTLRRFAALLVPLIFVAVLNGSDHAPFGNRESLGRFAFVAAMGVLVVLLAQLLGRRSSLMAPLFARAPRSLLVQLHPIWLSALVVLPIGMGALAGAGYFVAAGFFFTKTLQSLFVVLGALVLYGLIALWVQLQRRRLVRRQDDGRRRRPTWKPAKGAARRRRRRRRASTSRRSASRRARSSTSSPRCS
jgi:small-conductance mechanosensitive channel